MIPKVNAQFLFHVSHTHVIIVQMIDEPMFYTMPLLMYKSISYVIKFPINPCLMLSYVSRTHILYYAINNSCTQNYIYDK